jgi:hypothetical protein
LFLFDSAICFVSNWVIEKKSNSKKKLNTTSESPEFADTEVHAKEPADDFPGPFRPSESIHKISSELNHATITQSNESKSQTKTKTSSGHLEPPLKAAPITLPLASGPEVASGPFSSSSSSSSTFSTTSTASTAPLPINQGVPPLKMRTSRHSMGEKMATTATAAVQSQPAAALKSPVTKPQNSSEIGSESSTSPSTSKHSTHPSLSGEIPPSLDSAVSPEASPNGTRCHPHSARHQLSEHPPSAYDLRVVRTDHAHEKLIHFFGDPHVVEDYAKQGWAPQPHHVKELKLRQRFGEEIPFHTVSPKRKRHHTREASSDSESVSNDWEPEEVISKTRILRSTHKVHRFFGDHTAGTATGVAADSPSSTDLSLVDAGAGADNDSIIVVGRPKSSPSLSAITKSKSHHSITREKEIRTFESAAPSAQPYNVDVLKLSKFFGRRVSVVKLDVEHRRSTRSGSRDDMFFKTALERSRGGSNNDSASPSPKEKGVIGAGSDYFREVRRDSNSNSNSGSGKRARRNSDSEERPDSPAMASMAAEMAKHELTAPSDFILPTSKAQTKATTKPIVKKSAHSKRELVSASSSPSLRARKYSKSLVQQNQQVAESSNPGLPSASSSSTTLASRTSSKSFKSSTSPRKSKRKQSASSEMLDEEDNTPLDGKSKMMRRRSTLNHIDKAKQQIDPPRSSSSSKKSRAKLDSSGGSDDELRRDLVRDSHRNRKLRRMFGEDVSPTTADVQIAPQSNWRKLNRQFSFGNSDATSSSAVKPKL